MNKILNWITGSFFRTLGRIIAIGLISFIAYSFLSKSGFKISDLIGFQKVYADENFSYSNSLWSYTYSNLSTDCNSQLRNCSINPYPANMSLNTTANVDYVNTLRLYAYATDTNKFKSSNYYTFKYEVCQTEKDFNAIKSRGRGFSWQYNTTNAATGATAGDPTQFSYRIDDKVGDNSCYYLSFSVKPPVDSRYIGFFFTYTGYGDNSNVAVIPDSTYFDDTGGTINVKSLSVTYSADVNASINNQTNQLIDNQNENTQDIINNQNQNSQDLIDNQNQNTQDIINNQNQNIQDTINSQKICNSYDKNSISKDNYYLNYENIYVSYDTYGVTDFININGATIKILEGYSSNTNASYCFYNVNKTLISCSRITGLTSNSLLTIPDYSYYFKFSINKTSNKPQFEVCKNGNQGVSDSINDLNDSINNSDVSESTSEASNLFTNFTNDSHGLTAVVQAPLNFIQSLSSSTCSSLHLPIPYLANQYLDLPCLLPIYQSNFGSFLTIYQLIISGIVGYQIAVSVFFIVKDLKNPDSDKIEVLDL